MVEKNSNLNIKRHIKKSDSKIEEACVFFKKGTNLYKLFEYEAANIFFNKASLLDPKNPVYQNCKAFCLSALGKYEAAAKCHDMAIELAPDDMLYKINKQDFLTTLKHTDASLLLDAAGGVININSINKADKCKNASK